MGAGVELVGIYYRIRWPIFFIPILLTNLVAFRKLFNCSVPQFPHLQDGHNKNCQLKHVCSGLNGIRHVKHLIPDKYKLNGYYFQPSGEQTLLIISFPNLKDGGSAESLHIPLFFHSSISVSGLSSSIILYQQMKS